MKAEIKKGHLVIGEHRFDLKEDIDLGWIAVTSLPSGLGVNGDLFLDRTGIKELPDGLQVEGDLVIETGIILPQDLIVGGKINEKPQI